MCALDPFIDNFNYEDDSSFDKRRYIDAIQYSIKSFIGNSYLLWLCLILFLNGKDWKRPVIFILVLYWFLYSTSNLFLSYINYTNIIDFGVKGYDWPYTKRYWLFTNALPDLFLISGEIIADWYLFLRTKALIINKRKLKPIYITCIIYNIIKLIQIICNFLLTPSTFKRQEDKANTEILRYKIVWWSIILIIQLVSLIYDTFVILALKNNLFNKLEGFKNNSNNFMEKFKQISEYRIFISIFCSIILFPLAFIHLYIYIIWYKDPYKDFEDNSYLVEILRIDGLNFTYTFMYIDQFLLRFYINKNNATYSGKLPMDDNPHDTLINPWSDSFNGNSINFSNNTNINTPSSNKTNNNTQILSDNINNHSNTLQCRHEIKSSYYLLNLMKH